MAAESPRPRHILVYGVGAVGAFLGGRLASSGHSVTLLCRPAARTVIHGQGLRIDGTDGSTTLRIPVVTSIDELHDQPEVLLLTIKAYGLDDALPDLTRLARSGTAIATIQNGIGTEDRLSEIAELETLIAGSLTVSVASNGPSHVRQETSSGGIGLAEVCDRAGLIEPLRQAFDGAGIPAAVLPDYRQMKWSKLLLNILANATSAILAIDPGAIFADAALFEVERRAFIEALAVMAGQGLAPIELPGFNVPLLVYAMRTPAWLSRRLVGPRVAGGRGDKRPSLWIDVESGRGETEIAWLNGAVVREGDRLGIPTPVNHLLTRLVQDVAHDPERRHEFAGHPRRLLDEVAKAVKID
ncbi:MAG: ketopantoate reductase family protein [Nitrolancea sp.]